MFVGFIGFIGFRVYRAVQGPSRTQEEQFVQIRKHVDPFYEVAEVCGFFGASPAAFLSFAILVYLFFVWRV